MVASPADALRLLVDFPMIRQFPCQPLPPLPSSRVAGLFLVTVGYLLRAATYRPVAACAPLGKTHFLPVEVELQAESI